MWVEIKYFVFEIIPNLPNYPQCNLMHMFLHQWITEMNEIDPIVRTFPCTSLSYCSPPFRNMTCWWSRLLVNRKWDVGDLLLLCWLLYCFYCFIIFFGSGKVFRVNVISHMSHFVWKIAQPFKRLIRLTHEWKLLTCRGLFIPTSKSSLLFLWDFGWSRLSMRLLKVN